MKLRYCSLIIILTFSQISNATEYYIYNDPQSYVLCKLKTYDIFLFGTRHKQPSILEFISGLTPKLKESGVTHIGLEIASNQQDNINKFLNNATSLSDIQIHPQIDCPEYRNLFTLLRNLDSNQRPSPIAIDLPKSKYNESISRDEWMAQSIEKIFQQNPNEKMLIIIGNNNVLKKLDWQDYVPNPHRSIREYLSKKRSNLRIFSIGQIIGDFIYECDFREKFTGMNEAMPWISMNGLLDGGWGLHNRLRLNLQRRGNYWMG